MTQPIYAERWAPPPDPPATCPAAKPAVAYTGTPEPWTMTGGFAGYPVADPNARPPSVFRIYDPGDGRDPHEIIRVIDTGGTHVAPTAAWQVLRATEGSPGTAHAAGFEVVPFLTKAGLDGRAAGTPSGTGLVMPATLTNRQVLNGNLEHEVISLAVPAGEAIPASVYELFAWGFYTPGPSYTAGAPQPSTPHFNCALWWSPGSPGSIVFPTPGAQTGARWRIHASANLYAGQVRVTISMWVASSASPAAAVTPKALFGRIVDGPSGADTAIPAVFGLRITTGLVGTGAPAANSVTVQGARIWRAA